MARLRLKQFLAKTGAFSKAHEITKAIKEGIKVEDKIVRNPNFSIKSRHRVVYNGKELKAINRKIYLILNKPSGYVSQKGKGIKSIYDIIDKIESLTKEEKKTLFAVGRLDIYTEGLSILTNDGKLANKILQPKSSIKKTYFLILDKPLSMEHKTRIENGVDIKLKEDSSTKYYRTKKSDIIMLQDDELKITITEGKKRQIRRMFKAFNYKIKYLKRVSIANLTIGKLMPGEYKALTEEEISRKLLS